MSGSTTQRGRREDAARAAERLRRLALRLLDEIEDQSATVARTLHDDICQALAATNLGLFRLSNRLRGDEDAAALIAALRRELTLAAQSAHRLRIGLHPPAPARDCDLAETVGGEIERCRIECGIDIDARLAPGPHRPGRIGTAVVRRVVGLAIREAARRVPAGRLRVLIALGADGRLALSIDPRGYPARESTRAAYGYGRDELREWVELLGGRLQRTRSDGSIRLLDLELPLPDVVDGGLIGANPGHE